jgi:hypothetical protein
MNWRCRCGLIDHGKSGHYINSCPEYMERAQGGVDRETIEISDRKEIDVKKCRSGLT